LNESQKFGKIAPSNQRKVDIIPESRSGHYEPAMNSFKNQIKVFDDDMIATDQQHALTNQTLLNNPLSP